MLGHAEPKSNAQRWKEPGKPLLNSSGLSASKRDKKISTGEEWYPINIYHWQYMLLLFCPLYYWYRDIIYIYIRYIHILCACVYIHHILCTHWAPPSNGTPLNLLWALATFACFWFLISFDAFSLQVATWPNQHTTGSYIVDYDRSI